ncbi:MAG: transglycosylase domain-containing protein [Patescibacteria group bacterium]
MPRRKLAVSSKKPKKLKKKAKKTLPQERDFLVLPDIKKSLTGVKRLVHNLQPKITALNIGKITKKELKKRRLKSLSNKVKKSLESKRSPSHQQADQRRREIVVFRSKSRLIEDSLDQLRLVKLVFLRKVKRQIKKLKKVSKKVARTVKFFTRPRKNKQNQTAIVRVVASAVKSAKANNRKLRRSLSKSFQKLFLATKEYLQSYPSEIRQFRKRFKKNLRFQSRWLAIQRQKLKNQVVTAVLYLPYRILVALNLVKNDKRFFQFIPPKKNIILTPEQRKRKERRQILISILLTVAIVLSAWLTYDAIFADLPAASELKNREQVVTTKIYDRHGELLYRIYKDENRTLVKLKDISPHMINATIAIEDKSFYRHNGFDLKGIVRAFVANVRGDKIEQGGSTITQQLVKNRLLTTEKTVRRKLRELLLSVIVEATYSKDEILEMYFNQVPYGGSTYGVEEAAWRYFNKSAKDLTLAESALLAGLPAAPSVFSPYGPNPELAYQRQHEVLRRMVEDGYISTEQAETAAQEKITFRTDTIDIKAPHFVMYVKKLLAEKFGEETLTQGGLEVYTTLDLELQENAQKIVSEEIASLTRLRISNGASLVTNPRTGEILAMVGSADYFDFAHDGQVNVVLRERQPGSSIKPLTYAVAMEKGQNPSTIIDDAPITYKLVGSPPYSPKNYDGKYHGKVTLRESLASSYNIPAVKTLAAVGVDNVIDKAEALGIDTWQDRKRYGLSLTLGGGEVTMLDMSQLYSSFANLGYPVEPNPFLEIRNYRGEVFYRNDCALDQKQCFTEQKLDPKVAYLISDILSDDNARAPAFGLRSFLHIPGQQVAVKTGTTNSLRDNWTIGYTTDRLVAVWVGNNDNSPMSYVASGVTGASPIWNETMQLLLDSEKPHQFATPSGIVRLKVCAKTGTLPCAGCPLVKEEAFIQGMEPTKACSPAYFRPKTEEEKQREREASIR